MHSDDGYPLVRFPRVYRPPNAPPPTEAPLAGSAPVGATLPPKPPQPWRWQCHACRAVYRLSCTRRCLQCGHIMCPGGPATAGTSRKRQRRAGPCRSEFDYLGWSAWGRWRRQEEDVDGGGRTEEREARFFSRAHSCFERCDYPSECHHVRDALVRRRDPGNRAQATPRDAVDSVPAPDDEAPGDGGADLQAERESFYDENEESNGDEDDGDEDSDGDEDDGDEGSADEGSGGDEGSDGEQDGEMAEVLLPAEQARRSRTKLAQLTGHESFGPVDAACHVSPDARDGAPAADGSEAKVGWWARHRRSRKRRKCLSRVLGVQVNEPERRSDSDSESSDESDTEAGEEPDVRDEDMSDEQALVELSRLGRAFLRGAF